MLTIADVHLDMTCGACPEQYDATIGNQVVGYLRLQHGHFTVECPTTGGAYVYEAEPVGDGMFENWEREKYLTAAKEAILKWYLERDGTG